jgi:signal transduction histidine kinase
MKEDLSKPRAIVVLGRDLTERHKFEMQLFQSQKLAALGVMAGGIAHEIRNPLAVCSSAAQFLMKGDISPDFRKECADKVQKGIQRASDIIENLLKFARPSPEAEMAEIDLLSVLNETITLIFNQLKIQKIELRTTFPKGRVLVRGIANLIQQVFMNLFLNAINAMPDGGVLTISVKGLGNEVLVGVADTGHGISREDLHKIFDPFYTALPKSKGTGLGLSLCHSIVKLHFGSIEADSVEGKGSTFTVKFPIIYD